MEIVLWIIFCFSVFFYPRIGSNHPIITVLFGIPVISHVRSYISISGLLLVVLGGFIYTDKGWWYLGAVVLWILFLVIIPIRSSYSKYQAALNVLLAKYTYEKLERSNQAAVVNKTKQILLMGGFSNPAERLDNMNSKERYGFFALAMGELRIKPALSGYDWYYIENPFIALYKADNELWMAKNQLKTSHDVEIDI
jgi:hypothetical protein